MKKFLLLAGVACFAAANVQAKPVVLDQYVSAKVSYDWNRAKAKVNNNDTITRERLHKERLGSHVAYGVQAGFVRGELELNNSLPIKDNGYKVYKYSVMANGYFDFLNCSSWTPYVGAGIGTAWLKAKNSSMEPRLDKSVYNLAWQVMGGVAYKINSHWTVDASYRYADLGRVRKHDNFAEGFRTSKVAVRDHEAMLGVRYTF